MPNRLDDTLSKGMGVAKDPVRASQLFQGACDAKEAVACANIGELYWRGVGVAQDEARAKQLFKRACDLGDTKTCSY